MVRYLGISNWAAWRLMKANGIADKRGWNRVESVQAYYSITGRELEKEMVPLMVEENIGCLVWSPLAGGYLSGKYSPGAEGEAEGRRKTFDFPRLIKQKPTGRWRPCAPSPRRMTTSVAQVAIAYVLAKPWVTSVIIGARPRRSWMIICRPPS